MRSEPCAPPLPTGARRVERQAQRLDVTVGCEVRGNALATRGAHRALALRV
ncbi:MAG: hypothetical protein JWN10_2421, partial [Solirubrobacterales bacterium]|nr:hypothetical protein [Solirubrobacterales bacterium]